MQKKDVNQTIRYLALGVYEQSSHLLQRSLSFALKFKAFNPNFKLVWSGNVIIVLY